MARTGTCFAFASALTLLSACDPPTAATKVQKTDPPPAGTATVTGIVTTVTNEVIAGAVIKAQSSAIAVTDAGGRYQGTFPVPGIPIVVSAEKTGYLTVEQNFNPSVGAALVADFKLESLEQLTIGSTVSGTISAADPPTSIGNTWDSDYSRHTKYYTFSAPAEHDLIVELSWTPIGNAALVMWTQGGDIKSTPDGERQQIRLPHNTSGNLLVGQPGEAGPLTQVVPFTLDVRSAGAGAGAVRQK